MSGHMIKSTVSESIIVSRQYEEYPDISMNPLTALEPSAPAYRTVVTTVSKPMPSAYSVARICVMTMNFQRTATEMALDQ
jgi:hypothetical protein